jgi:hypothetical protein
MTKRTNLATRIDTLLGAVAALQERSKVCVICDETCELVGGDQISDALTVARNIGLELQRYYQRKARRELKRGE